MPRLNKNTTILILALILISLVFIFLKWKWGSSPPPIQPSPPPPLSTQPSSNLPILPPPTFLSHPSLPNLPTQIQLKLSQPPTLPPSLTVYQFIPNPDTDYLALAQRLGFTSPPTTSAKYLSWHQSDSSLTINVNTSQLSLITYLPPTTDFANSQSLETYTRQLITQISISSLWANPTLNLTYFSGSSESLVLTQNPSSATVAKVSASPSINQYPIYSFTTSTAQFTINPKDKSVSVAFPLASGTLLSQSEYPLVTPNQLTPQFLSQAKIITPNKLLLSASITSLSLAYFIDSTQGNQILQPILVLAGTAPAQDFSSAQLTAFFPAIKPEYLLTP